MQTTPNMGLTKWDLSADPYDHNQFAANWQSIDTHNHSGPPHGVQISGASLLPGTVGTAQIALQAITSALIANGAVGAQQLDQQFVNPLGSVRLWWRPSSLSPIPTGWVIAMGQTLAPGQHGFPDSGSVVLPDLRGKFVVGADVSGTGTGPSQSPAIGQSVGNNAPDLSHTHTIGTHSHTVPGHSHVVNSHVHGVSDHSHIMNPDGAHSHQFFNQDDGNYYTVKQRGGLQGTTGGIIQSLYVPGLNSGASSPGTSEDAPLSTVGAHNHLGFTRGMSGPTSTDAQSPGTDAPGLTTNASSSGSTSSGLGATDTRPAAIGLLPLIKVLHL